MIEQKTILTPAISNKVHLPNYSFKDSFSQLFKSFAYSQYPEDHKFMKSSFPQENKSHFFDPHLNHYE